MVESGRGGMFVYVNDYRSNARKLTIHETCQEYTKRHGRVGAPLARGRQLEVYHVKHSESSVCDVTVVLRRSLATAINWKVSTKGTSFTQ